jgi:hypothetical protein
LKTAEVQASVGSNPTPSATDGPQSGLKAAGWAGPGSPALETEGVDPSERKILEE